MSVKKRTYNSGKTVWYFIIDAPGSTRANRRQIKESGFATKNEARNAEAGRRVEEQKKYELAQVRSVVDAPLPKTLGALLKEFFQEHAEKKLAPKTVERYREQAGYLAQELLEMPLEGITALHLGREWNRLLESGVHHRKTKVARPLSAKTVLNIAGVVSSAFARAIRWGLVTSNPVQNSEPPGCITTPGAFVRSRHCGYLQPRDARARRRRRRSGGNRRVAWRTTGKQRIPKRG